MFIDLLLISYALYVYAFKNESNLDSYNMIRKTVNKKDFLNAPDKDSEIKIITLDKCPYSIGAISFLKDNNIPFINYVVNRSRDNDIRDIYGAAHNTFPVIFLNGVYKGGYEDIQYDPEINKLIKSNYNKLKHDREINELIKYNDADRNLLI